MINKNITITKNSQNEEIFDCNTTLYNRLQFKYLEKDGTIKIVYNYDKSKENSNIEVTDTDITIRINAIDTNALQNTGGVYYLYGKTIENEKYTIVFTGEVNIVDNSTENAVLLNWEEGKIGKINKPIAEIDQNNRYDLICDQSGDYYIKKNGQYVKLMTN